MANELVAEEFLQTTLEGDAQLAAAIGGAVEVYWGSGPDTAGETFIVLDQVTGADLEEVGGEPIWLDEAYLVKVVKQTESWAAIGPVYARVHALLHKAAGATASGNVVACVRESVVKQSEIDQGKAYLALGGIYRIQTQ